MGSKVRQNCRWIPREQPVTELSGGKYVAFDDADHPDFLRILRSLQSYDEWVSNKLIPIACKWIEENRDELIRNMSEEEMNDMGAAIEAAYKLIEASGWIEERTKAGAVFDPHSSDINPLWRRRSADYIEAERNIGHG